MRNTLIAILVLTAVACTESERLLAPIQVHEWGVLTWSGNDPVFSGVPGTPSPEIAPLDDDGFLLRAPVLYFHGPAFSGTVTVKTNNGSIFDIYPSVPDENRDHSHCTWTVDLDYADIEEYPDFHGMAPGEWNYDLWRNVYALSISGDNGWNDKFLYYETAPATTEFLPYRPGMESLCDEYMDVKALVIRRLNDGIYFSHCTLRDVVYGGDLEYLEMTPDDILGVLYDWSLDVINVDEVDALWNTWSSWMTREYIYEQGFEESLLMYMIPAELTDRLSTVSVVPDPDGPEFPVEISRYLIVAMPL
ncbi:MAG: hypothetical protein KAH54_07095 [Candidatus Sabulitectum sp.]|nr:hypothetical protein [Candidatus Sabulitectum sp.]